MAVTVNTCVLVPSAVMLALAGVKVDAVASAAPALTVIEGLMSGVFDGVVMSEAMIIAVPAVFKVTLKVFVPATSAASLGNVAAPSSELRWTVSVEVTTFQPSSTALIVTGKGVPAV